MAKIGDYRYPDDLDPEEAEKVVDALVNDFGGKAENREAFAQALGHKSKNSGAFTRKIADARKYRLLTPRGDYEATDLGFRLANPKNPTDRKTTFFEALENIEILSDLHRELNGNDPPDQLWRVLTDMTDTNPKEARDAAGRLKELYQSMLRYNVDQESNSDSDLQDSRHRSDKGATESDKDAIEPNKQTTDSNLYIRAGDDELKFSDLSDINIQLAVQFLKSKQGEDSKSGDDGPGHQSQLN